MIESQISVIIPMYNAEKYIRSCLISVFASKFKDYEVIVVNDCSTDNSVSEVEKLLTHFGGRLKILSTEENSGGAGIPRNIGIKNSSGKYITFLDSDDFILPTALGDFYELAEKFQADVVHTEKFFAFNDSGKSNFGLKELTLQRHEKGNAVEIPVLETKSLKERIYRCIDGKFLWMPWGKFYRRNFLLENEIFFPNMKLTEDLVFCFQCFCFAKKYLRIPHVTNIYRMNQNSISKKIISSEAGVKLWLSSITEGFNLIHRFMDELEDFRGNSELGHLTAKFLINVYFGMIKNLFQGLEPHEVQKIFYEELSNPELDLKGKNLIAAYLYTERAINQTR